MKIINLTVDEILCSIDQECYWIEPNQSLSVGNFNIMRISHKYTSYSTSESGNSRILKLLSLVDDPFKLRKEYHVVVDLEILKSQICNNQDIVITPNTNYVDSETRNIL